MAHDRSGRLSRARAGVEAAGLGALVVAPGPELQYLVGYDPPPLERLTALVIRAGEDPVLLVPHLERPRAASSGVERLVAIETWRDGDSSSAAAARLLPPAGRFGVTDRMWAAHLMGLQTEVPNAAFVPGSSVISALRARKDAAEMDLLSRAARATDLAFERIREEALEGRSEAEVASSLSAHLVACGLDSVAFCIVGSGPNAASPHHEPGERRLAVGDALVLDFGGRVGGYCSDMTRTLALGEASPELNEIHSIVRAAHEAAFGAVGPGVPAEEIDRAARGVVDSAGYGAAFFHRTGHGIGLEEHEDPYVVAGNQRPLQAGNCFSIEPGIYLEGKLGVRIEDIVAVTEEGATSLNNAPRDLLVIG